MEKTAKQLPPGYILADIFIISTLPFVMVELFHAQLYQIMNIASYLVFHNIAEFFSVMVSLSIFSVGWYTYEQSGDRHALFLSSAFLAIGLMDFMHTLSYAGMPAFITPNSANKAAQFWIAVRMFAASTFLVSAYVYPNSESRWLSKTMLMTEALSVSGLVFIGIIFFPSYLPATFIEGVGLTAFKKFSEYIIIGLLIIATSAYWKRMSRTGEKRLIYYLAALVICIFSELVFAAYKSVYDTYNILGHIYKIAAFYLIYEGIFTTSVKAPYIKLSETGEKLRMEINEHKAAENEILRLNAELEQRVEQRTAQLEEANRELEAFAYSVSHDLRTPLRGIDCFSKVLLEEYEAKLDEQGKHYLRRVRGASQRMAQLIDNILKLSHATRGEMNQETVDLSALAEAIAAELKEREPGRQVEFVIAGGITATGDANLLRAMLENLLGNAWKFTAHREQARIEFGRSEDDGRRAFYVRDNGAGFDMTYADKLFIPFQRLHTEEEFSGTGIGLAQVQRIVQRQGGEVWADGALDKGATFYFTLQ